MQSSYNILYNLLKFGRTNVSSTMRLGAREGYHETGQAMDFVPVNKLINIVIFYLFWPGGMGVHLS